MAIVFKKIKLMQEPDLFKIFIQISKNLENDENCQGNFYFVSRLQPSELEVPSPIRDHRGRIKAWIESYGNAWWHRTVLAMGRDAHSNAEIGAEAFSEKSKGEDVLKCYQMPLCLCRGHGYHLLLVAWLWMSLFLLSQLWFLKWTEPGKRCSDGRLFILAIAIWTSCLGVFQFADDPSQADENTSIVESWRICSSQVRQVEFYTDPRPVSKRCVMSDM